MRKASSPQKHIFDIAVDGVQGCEFLPGPGKNPQEDTVCKQADAIAQMLVEWGTVYSAVELRGQCCTPNDPATRDSICPARRSLSEGGRSSCWARR